MRRFLAPAYRLHKASGQAVCHLGGRDVYLGRHGTPESHAKYEELVTAKRDRFEQDERKRRSDAIAAQLERSIGRVDVTIDELIASYLPHVNHHYIKHGRPTSQATLIRLSLRVLSAKFGDLDARTFGPRALKECRDAFVASNLCRSEVNRRTGLIVQAFKWAVQEEVIPESVWGALRSVEGLQAGRTTAVDHGPVTPVSEADLAATLPHLGETVSAMVRVQELTGMRPSEVCGLRRDEINTSGEIWEYAPRHHKLEHRGKARVIMIGPKAQGIINEFRRPVVNVFDPDAPPSAASPFVFPPERGGKPGECYAVSGYRRAIERACKRAGVPVWSPNQLRHLAASRMRRAMGLDVSRALLGHSSAVTTEIYAQQDAELSREAMRKFG